MGGAVLGFLWAITVFIGVYKSILLPHKSLTDSVNPVTIIKSIPLQEQFGHSAYIYFEKKGEDVLEGSGVMVSSDGYIAALYNGKKSPDTDKYYVIFQGQKYAVKSIVSDEKWGLSFYKIDIKNVPIVTFADIEDLKAGDTLMYFDSNFVKKEAIFSGVSILEQEEYSSEIIPRIYKIENQEILFSVPVYNTSEDLVGIADTFGEIIDHTHISFLIPSLFLSGQVKKPVLGIEYSFQDQVVITKLKKPANDAGLKIGDKILLFDGIFVNERQTLPELVARSVPGTSVMIEYERDTKKYLQEITLGFLN